MAKKMKKPRAWQSLKNRFLRNIVPNLNNYNFGVDVCNKIRLGMNPPVSKNSQKKKVEQLFADNNLSPLTSANDDSFTEIRRQKRPAETPPKTPPPPRISQSPNRTDRTGGIAKKRKLANPKDFFRDSPISDASRGEPRKSGAGQKKNSNSQSKVSSQRIINSMPPPPPQAMQPSKKPPPRNQLKQPLLKTALNRKTPPVAATEEEEDRRSKPVQQPEVDSRSYKEQQSEVNTTLETSTASTVSRRDLFSFEEDLAILRFIVDTKRYSEVKGNVLWEAMEKAKVCPGRTYQSMKERFRRRIVPKLEKFKTKLSDLELKKIREYSTTDAKR